MDAQERSPLILNWHDRRAVLDERRGTVALGALETSGLQVAGPFTSRHHATIERRKHDYVLVDHSTNGTFVQTEDERVAFVRRGEVRLWGEGWISLGDPLSEDSAIRFRHG
ncbi:MAG: FHA domain-containing protein [Pseudomonadales bacterium]